jgi:hypothetical protein
MVYKYKIDYGWNFFEIPTCAYPFSDPLIHKSQKWGFWSKITNSVTKMEGFQKKIIFVVFVFMKNDTLSQKFNP